MTNAPHHSSVRRGVPTSAIFVIALVGAFATRGAAAQEPTGRFAVVTRAGAFKFERAASLETTPFLGLDLEYGLNKNFTLGTSVNVGRPRTNADDFQTTLTYGFPGSGDTTFFYNLGQSVNLVQAALMGTARFPIGSRLTPYASAGFGGYGAFLDPQINRGTRRFSGTSAQFGGGVNVRLSDRAGIQLDVRDMVFMNYKRSALDPSGGRFPDATFAEFSDAIPAAKKTINNIAFSIGFRYIPAGGGGGSGAPNSGSSAEAGK